MNKKLPLVSIIVPTKNRPVLLAEAYQLVTNETLAQDPLMLLKPEYASQQALDQPQVSEDLPLVSVLIRSMNRPTLQDALDSVALQTYSHIEVVVIAACGQAHSIIGEACGRFPLRLEFAPDGRPLSRPHAANLALERAKGKWLIFLDDDDTFDPDHIAGLIQTLRQHPQAKAIYAGVRVEDNEGQVTGIFNFPYDPRRLLTSNFIPIHALLFSRELIEENGARFDENMEVYEDWDFWLQLSCHTSFLHLNKISAVYRGLGDSGVGLTANEDMQQQGREHLFDKWRLLWTGKDIDELAQYLFEQERILTELAEERDRQITNLNLLAEERDRQIANLNQILAERDGEINALLSSTSWRLTKSLRWIGTQVLRGKLLLKALTLANAHTGETKKTLIKLVDVYKRENLQGVRARIRFLLERNTFQRSIRRVSEFNASDQPSVNRNKEVVPHHQSVDVIVCVHNALDDVKRCLESVMCNTYPPYNLIIVDDGSGQETKEYLKTFIVGQPAMLIRNAVATGYTKAANTGMRASKGDFVVLLNSDTIVAPRWLDRLIQCANSSEQIGMAGPLSNTASWQSVPQIANEKGDWAANPLPHNWSVKDYANEVARVSPRIYPHVGFLNGFCLLIKRELISDIGLFDEETFARGYGEENDYALRATANGWQLAVADDCYVYHAQSKSYSHEIRTELARLAGEALATKHGQVRIDHNLSMTKPHPALHYMRLRCTEIEEISSLRAEAQWRFEGKRVLFLLPAGSAGGGSNIVLLEAECMHALGVDAWIANLEVHRPLFEQSHPDVQVPVLYLQSSEDLIKVALDFDAVIATLYLTVFWMEPLRKSDRCPVLGYYIQDFEPDFFEEGSTIYQTALMSYTAIPDLCLFTKTNWNQRTLHNKLGVSTSVIGLSLDIDKFHPPSIIRTEVGVVKILAMVRPSTPRRAPAATMRVLKRLAKHFGARIRITIFGVNPDNAEFLTYSNDFTHSNLGEIDAQGVAAALSDADIFVDCSIFQAMGLTAMEAMASGVAVVGPVNGGLKEIILAGHNGMLVDTQHEDRIFSAVAQLISDNELRARIQRNALEVLTHSPFFSSFKILNCLFPQMHRAIDNQYPQDSLHDAY